MSGGTKVWSQVTALGKMPGVTDLGQGYPDTVGCEVARVEAARCMSLPSSTSGGLSSTSSASSSSSASASASASASIFASSAPSSDEGVRAAQYAPIPGTTRLTNALTDYYNRLYPGADDLGEGSVVVTTSGTEALYAAVMAFAGPGDEVIVFEPYFPWYVPHVRLAGATPRLVRLRPPAFGLDEHEVRAAFNSRTKMIIFNTPHNPSGHVATPKELALIAELCREHDVLALADEVYECVTFGRGGGREVSASTGDGGDGMSVKMHRRLADEPGMRDRTLTVGSASKMFSLTGWRVGWVTGPTELVAGVRAIHGYTSFSAPTPLQEGVAAALEAGAQDDVASLFEENARRLAAALRTGLGLESYPVEGGYFLLANTLPTGMNGTAFCEWLAHNCGVSCAPLSVFYNGVEAESEENYIVRFAICKTRETIDAAVAKLEAAAEHALKKE